LNVFLITGMISCNSKRSNCN